MSMSPEVQAEYDRVLARVVVKHGTLVSQQPSAFGWIASDYDHLRTCTVVAHGTPDEETWYEFAGTFAPTDAGRCHGIRLTGVTCACGALRDRTVRLQQSLSEVIAVVFTEMYVELKAQRSPIDEE